MNLYKEEQKRYLYTLFNYFHQEHNLILLNEEMEEIVNIVKNNYLELPSDEEIENRINTHNPYPKQKQMHIDWANGFERGAKWMKEQILNQNK